jgi:hypothetical protein
MIYHYARLNASRQGVCARTIHVLREQSRGSSASYLKVAKFLCGPQSLMQPPMLSLVQNLVKAPHVDNGPRWPRGIVIHLAVWPIPSLGCRAFTTATTSPTLSPRNIDSLLTSDLLRAISCLLAGIDSLRDAAIVRLHQYINDLLPYLPSTAQL